MLIFSKEGIITTDDDKTNISHQFIVPKGTNTITVHYSYSPKTVENSEQADKILLEAMKKYQAEAFDKSAFEPVKNLITLSFDECGKYRGACHRQPNEQTVVIAETESTPGIINRPVEAGKWNVVLNVHFAGCNVNYRIDIEAGEEIK